MSDIAFYAPLKSPHHPVPSGEREMARNLMSAIGEGWPSGRVRLVSELRSHEPNGDAGLQDRIFAAAEEEARRLVAELGSSRPALWVTYHNYYKAPDLLGPRVSAALAIPYVVVEASRARRRLTGPWARFAAAAEAASDAAAIIYYVTQLDLITLKRDQSPSQRLVQLRPFLPLRTLPPEADRRQGRILSVGMFRGRAKLGSYRIISESLALLARPDWQLDIVGDGPARSEIEALMAPFGDRVRFLGVLDRCALDAAYGAASVFFWPGFNEAFGMVYLEAQAAGLPVVAQDRDGVRDVLAPGVYPAAEAGPAPLAQMIDALLDDPELCRSRGAAARAHVARHHLMAAARETFWAAAGSLVGARA